MIRTDSGRAQEKKPAVPVKTVRGLLLLRGETLSDWARRRGYRSQYVQLALRGMRHGPKARRIREEITRELGL